jgi:hypothetical protein
MISDGSIVNHRAAETDRKMPFFFLFGAADGGACKMIYDLGNLGTTQKVIVCFVDTWAYLLPCQEWWNLMVIWSDLFEILMFVVHILISTQIEDVSTQSLFQLLCSSYQSCNWNIMFIAAKFNVCNMIDCWYTVDVLFLGYTCCSISSCPDTSTCRFSGFAGLVPVTTPRTDTQK